MRYLLILLTAITLSGQDIRINQIILDDSVDYTEEYLIVKGFDGKGSMHLREFTHELKWQFAVFLNQYAEECYADSTYHECRWEKGCYPKNPDDWNVKYDTTYYSFAGDSTEYPNIQKIYWFWEHRTPSLPDFIKWINREVK